MLQLNPTPFTHLNPKSRASPRISVVMPLYNAELFIGEALASISAQTVHVAEVIVVDDGSTDGSAAVAASFPFVTLVRKPHEGINATLNRGLAASTGDFLAFLDADDRWFPAKTALQLAAFQADCELDAVFGHSRRFRSLPGKPDEEILDLVPGVTKSCLLIKRASFEKVGRFLEEETVHDFLDWYCRAVEANLRMKMLPEAVAERRIHGNNYGVLRRDHERRSYLTALKASLDRRRASQVSKRIEPVS